MRAGLIFLLILGACREADSPPPLPMDACGAAALQRLVGQDARVLQTMRFGQQVRILRPGDPATKDYRPDRLNILIDAQERISRIDCG